MKVHHVVSMELTLKMTLYRKNKVGQFTLFVCLRNSDAKIPFQTMFLTCDTSRKQIIAFSHLKQLWVSSSVFSSLHLLFQEQLLVSTVCPAIPSR